MHSIGAMTMAKGYNNSKGRPLQGEEAMISKGVHLPPQMWEDLEDEAKEKGTKENRRVTRAEIMREAVDAFFRTSQDKAPAIHRVPMHGVIFGGQAQSVQSFPDSPSIVLPFEVGSDCYSLCVVGSSMESEDGISIPNGHYAVFCPQNNPTPGALVHVEWEENGERVCTFKKYIPRPDGGAIFRPLNPDAKHKPMVRAKGEYQIRGVFVRSWDGKTPSHLQ